MKQQTSTMMGTAAIATGLLLAAAAPSEAQERT